MGALPTGTVTFVISDIEGSTRRWAEDPAMEEALAIHDRITRSSIESHDGVWVKHTGDGALAAFDTPGAAAVAAADIQRALEAAPWPGTPLMVRIGIHTGAATAHDGDYHGLTVSATARVADAGHGGQVLLSEAAATLLDSLPDGLQLVDLGPDRLKDLEGARHLHQLAGEGLEGTFPPLRTLERIDHNLPPQRTAFIGRERELARVGQLLDDQHLVTLTGVGGAGKTRLSLQIAAMVAAGYRDGARFVELASVSDPDGVPAAFAVGLGVRYEQGEAGDVIDRVVDHSRDRNLLVVVDNCEHVLEAAADVVDRLLSEAPATRARTMTIWEYWKTYCDARRVEALAATGRPDDEERDRVRSHAAALDMAWITGLLDDVS